MDPVGFITGARVLEERPDPPALILGRALQLYEIDLSSADFAIEEKLPPGDRAVLQLAQALGVVTAADVRAYLGLGPELSPHVVARLEKIGLLRATEISPRSTSAREVEPVRIERGPGLALTDAGVQALAAGARVVIRQQPLRLVMSDDPLVVLRVLPPPVHARARRDPPLPPADVPAPLQALDALLRAAPRDRFAALGLQEALTEVPGGERIEGHLLGCSAAEPYEVRPAPENLEGWLLTAVHAAPLEHLAPRLYAVAIRRDSTDLRPLAHVDPFAAVPPWLRARADMDRIFTEAGLHLCSPAIEPAFPVFADGAFLLELLGRGDQPAPVWRSLPVPGGGFFARARLRAIPTSVEAAHDALLAFLARRQESLRTGLERTLARTWSQLCSFWAWNDAIPPETGMVRERLWAQPALRGVLCAGRLERDLVAPYLAEVSSD